MISFTEFTEVLKYEADVYRFTILSKEERWSIAQERSIILGDNARKSYISKNAYAKCEKLLREIKNQNWSRTN
jgi:hypothetical protein